MRLFVMKNGTSAARLIIFFSLAFLQGCGDNKRIEMVRVPGIKSISASSYYQGFVPSLMLDSGASDEDAWHSQTRPHFPQWVEVEYPAPVVLDKIAIQAQFDAANRKTNNLKRAPRQIEIWGRDDRNPETYTKLVEFDCTYEKPGSWCTRETRIPDSKRYRFLRLSILSNFGDLDFITIQELNLFSHE